jgi:hypothetical protein
VRARRARRRRTVVVVREITVDSPLKDGARASTEQLGVFSSIAAVREAPWWLLGLRNDDFHYYSLDEYRLDEPRGAARSFIVDGETRRVRGIASGFHARPWDGRPRCRYKPVQLVGFVLGETWRVGIVLALPQRPGDARRLELHVGDDVALVGLVGVRGSPTRRDHERLAPPLLFPLRHPIPGPLRQKLKARHERYVQTTLRLSQSRSNQEAREERNARRKS